MNENNQNESDSSNRSFDWGPPANSFFEGLKEWLVYVILLLLFATGAWFFLDINAQKMENAQKIIALPAAKPLTQIQSNSKPLEEKQEGSFQVQLGAFADKKNANTSYDALKAAGFEPTLSEPDSQYEIYRVSVGPFSSEQEAEKVSEQLNSLNFHCFVIESP